MPAIVGAISVKTIGTSSVLHVGDVYSINPYSQAKTYAGGGSFNTGEGVTVRLDKAITNITDQDQFDQNVTGI
ncbi:spore germination protein [Amphibacillus sediminis]|uniref:spore germination protein n=1 Tax=Amphibacillus sediminis TaxID=360185 RepID=UPI0008296C2F|nr:spore germination protein [Amphibacillus sediminis]